jgi:hypothetical protein
MRPLQLDALRESGTDLLGRTTLAEGWLIPASLRLESGRLIYERGSERRAAKRVNESTEMLEDFLRLSGGTDEEIFRYARRWGILGLCAHNLPASHRSLIDLSWASNREKDGEAPSPFLEAIPKGQTLHQPDRDIGEFCLPATIDGEWAESLDAWRWYARTTRRLLEKAAALQKRRRRRAAEHEWREIVRWLNDWMWLAPTRVHGVATKRGPTVRLRPLYSLPALSAVLAAQALFAASRSRGLSTCSNCGDLHTPSVRIPENKRTYCAKAKCKRAARRDAAATFRSRHPGYFRKFRAKDYSRKGLSVDEISSRLRVNVEQVQEWLKESDDGKD